MDTRLSLPLVAAEIKFHFYDRGKRLSIYEVQKTRHVRHTLHDIFRLTYLTKDNVFLLIP